MARSGPEKAFEQPPLFDVEGADPPRSSSTRRTTKRTSRRGGRSFPEKSGRDVGVEFDIEYRNQPHTRGEASGANLPEDYVLARDALLLRLNRARPGGGEAQERTLNHSAIDLRDNDAS